MIKGGGKRGGAGEKERGKQNKPRQGQWRKQGGLGGGHATCFGAAECARSMAVWRRQAAAKQKPV